MNTHRPLHLGLPLTLAMLGTACAASEVDPRASASDECTLARDAVAACGGDTSGAFDADCASLGARDVVAARCAGKVDAVVAAGFLSGELDAPCSYSFECGWLDEDARSFLSGRRIAAGAPLYCLPTGSTDGAAYSCQPIGYNLACDRTWQCGDGFHCNEHTAEVAGFALCVRDEEPLTLGDCVRVGCDRERCVSAEEAAAEGDLEACAEPSAVAECYDRAICAPLRGGCGFLETEGFRQCLEAAAQ